MLNKNNAFFCLILLFCFPFFIINCSDDAVTPAPADSSDFKYPFTDGSTWTYQREISVSDIKPDSIQYHFSDYPIIVTGTVTILYDTVINSVTTKCFLDEFTSRNGNRSSRFYYVNNDTSLYLYFSRSSPANGLLPLNIVRNNFNPLPDVSYLPYGNEYNRINFTDTIFSILKYPVITGKEWIYYNGFDTIIKKYEAFENVTVPAGTISCIKTTTSFSSLPSSSVINYYSKSGLMKKTWFLDDMTFSTITNPGGIGTIDVNDFSEILSFNIPLD